MYDLLIIFEYVPLKGTGDCLYTGTHHTSLKLLINIVFLFDMLV